MHVHIDDENRLNIRIEEPMIQAMFFEIYILAIVNELYFRRLETPAVLAEGEKRLRDNYLKAGCRAQNCPSAAAQVQSYP